jgi:hypothetical protein
MNDVLSRSSLFVALCFVVACSRSVGPGDDDAGMDGDAEVRFVPVGVETVAPAQVAAGDIVLVHCLLLDALGESNVPLPDQSYFVRVDPEDSIAFGDDGTTIIARRAGEVAVTCVFPSLGLVDASPAIVGISPGPIAAVEAHVDTDAIVAGQSVTTSCTGVDAYGNAVEVTDPVIAVDPPAAGNVVALDVVTFARSGLYDVRCDVAGATSRSVRVEVRPDLPASLVIALSPNETVYAVGQVITLERIVADRFGNRIDDVPVPVTHDAAMGQSIGEGRVRFLADGTYTLTATVTPPTQDDIPLTASVMVTVDSSGPVIGCGSPANAAILNQAPGSSVTFNGTVSDASGVASVRVNGTNVAVNGSGGFSRAITSVFGINFVEVAATDTNGVETTRLCSFLLADQWAPPNASLYNDTVALRLAQAAIDDGNRSAPINSLGDILHAVLNSNGLRTTLHNALLAANPLKPNACDQNVCVPIVGCACVLRSEVTYLNSQINGPNTAQLTLVNGGVQANVVLRDVRVQLRIRGSVVGIGYDTTGWATISSVTIGLIFDTALAGGRPRVTVRPGSVSTSVGSISTSFSGIDGALINIGVTIANGTVRNLVSNLLTSYVRDNFNAVLDSVLGNLNIDSLGTAFSVPRLDGSGSVNLAFGISFSSLGASASRMLFGIGTRLSGPSAHARPTLGTPIPTGTVLLDPSTTSAAAVSVHVGVIGQALHALWRAGFFDVTLDAGDVPGLPAGVTAQLTTRLPPAVRLVGSRIELSLGAADLRLTYPALFATPIDAAVGIRASMRVALVGNDLVFDDFTIDDLRFSTSSTNLDAMTRDTVEDLLERILGRIVGRALNDALPAIPIPSFALPASLGQFGLPTGVSVGVTSPSLGTSARHFTLSGGFGLR